jgi:hypothetical protein
MPRDPNFPRLKDLSKIVLPSADPYLTSNLPDAAHAVQQTTVGFTMTLAKLSADVRDGGAPYSVL